MTSIWADERIIVALIIGFAGLFVKYVLRPFISYLVQKSKRIVRIFSELVPNGGNSMWDKIDRMDKRTQALVDSQLTGLHLIRMVASHTAKIMWTADKDGNTDWMNEHWMDKTGIPIAHSMGYGWLNGLHSDDREWVIEAWQAAVEHGRDFIETFRLEHDVTNKITTVKAKASPIKDPNNHHIAGWTGIMVEVPPQ